MGCGTSKKVIEKILKNNCDSQDPGKIYLTKYQKHTLYGDINGYGYTEIKNFRSLKDTISTNEIEKYDNTERIGIMFKTSKTVSIKSGTSIQM